MRHDRSHTKVIATIGPGTRNKQILEKMFHEGVDVCRFNCSHDTHEEHMKTIKYINELNEELGTNVAILADLQGPKLRVGEMENDSVMLEDGQKFSFVTTPCMGTAEQAYLSYDKLPQDATPGEMILVDDGKLMFEVIESNGKDRVLTKVIAGGPLSTKKGSTFRILKYLLQVSLKRILKIYNLPWIRRSTGWLSPLSEGRKTL